MVQGGSPVLVPLGGEEQTGSLMQPVIILEPSGLVHPPLLAGKSTAVQINLRKCIGNTFGLTLTPPGGNLRHKRVGITNRGPVTVSLHLQHKVAHFSFIYL